LPTENILETIKELGDGMQAKIYLARDTHHRKEVCLKVFKPDIDLSEMNSAEEEFRV